MKKAILKILFVIVFIFLIYINYNYYKEIKEEQKVPEEKEFSWQANYIWADESSPNMWACFRKNFNIDDVNKTGIVKFRIAVDSKYYMYINGKLVVRDGGLKKQVRDAIYYDEIDATQYMQKGNNNISILVWYYGVSSFSHVDTGSGALLFQGQVGDETIISDESWKVIINPAYLKDEEQNNKRLAEKNIVYDASKEIVGWYNTKFDDSSWQNATIVGSISDERYGELIPRDIPYFSFSSGISNNQEAEEKYFNKICDEDTVIKIELRNNSQVYPYIKVNSEKGKKILVSNIHDFNNELFYGKITYYTKDGVQEYESPSWINGDVLYFYIPKGVKVLTLGYRSTRYPAWQRGLFESDDEELNKLWIMSRNTLEVNMRETYMDCPDRERALWIADTSLSMEEAMYSLSIEANDLYEKCIRTFVSWQDSYALPTVVPPICANLQLPIQNLIGIRSLYEYYLYTGNTGIVEHAYPHFKKYMELWEVGDDGLIRGVGEYFWNHLEWYDSQGKVDKKLSENVWYYYSLQGMSELAKALGYEEDAAYFGERLNKIKEGIENEFFDGTAYKSKNFKGYDARANSIIVISRIAGEEKYEGIFNSIKDNTDNSVFMEKYILEAFCRMGKFSEAQDRMKTRYDAMINNVGYSSTLWEYWDYRDGSKNHAWAGGPLVIMSKYFAGISPNKPGYEEVKIKPEFGNLNNIKAKIETVNGNISVEANKTENEITYIIDTRTKSIVYIDKMKENNLTIELNKGVGSKDYYVEVEPEELNETENEYIFVLDSGSYRITSK